MYLALGIATVVYVAIAIGVFGTLTVEKVIAVRTHRDRGRGPADARTGRLLADERDGAVRDGRRDKRRPLPGRGAVRGARVDGSVPALMGGQLRGSRSVGLVIASVAILVMVVVFDLSSIASIGSAVALTIFALVTLGHLRVYGRRAPEPGCSSSPCW